MEFLKQWTVCVCITLVVSVIFSLFTPSGRMKSFYKILISLFVFVSFLYPFSDFKGFEKELDFDSYKISSNQKYFGAYELMLESEIKSRLSENGVDCLDVECSVVSVTDGEIEVKEVTVFVKSESDIKRAEDVVFESFGIKARVINSG